MNKKRDFWEASYIQYFWEAKGYTIIFLDEFHINMRSESIYNWSWRGTLSVVAVEVDPWNLGFVVVFSKRRIEGILESNFSINAKTFILNGLWDRLKNEGLQEKIISYYRKCQSAQMTRNNQISWEETSKINNNPFVFSTA